MMQSQTQFALNDGQTVPSTGPSYSPEEPHNPFPLTKKAMPYGIAFFFAGYLLTGELTGGLGLAVFISIFTLLYRRSEPPVLVLALLFQWLQVVAGYYYYIWTGRITLGYNVTTIFSAVQLGCISLLCLAIGLRWGIGFILPARTNKPNDIDDHRGPSNALWMLYIGFFLGHGTISILAWRFGGLVQQILSFAELKWIFYFVLMYRLFRSQSRLAYMVIGVEAIVGISGYFSGFKVPIFFGFMAAVFAWRDRQRPWGAILIFLVILGVLGLFWTAVKTEYRQQQRENQEVDTGTERLMLLMEISQQRGWDQEMLLVTTDAFVERFSNIWQLGYALRRVPSAMPHAEGELMGRAFLNFLQPRILVPDKIGIMHDSEKVIKYTGLKVAGYEQGTSVAFGYVAESYVDFGVPGMFFPIMFFGIIFGMIYGGLISLFPNRELAIGYQCALTFQTLYIFERGWDKTLGMFLTYLIFQTICLYMLTQVFPSVFPHPEDIPKNTNPETETGSQPAVT